MLPHQATLSFDFWFSIL